MRLYANLALFDAAFFGGYNGQDIFNGSIYFITGINHHVIEITDLLLFHSRRFQAHC